MSAKAPVDPIRKFLETARHQISVGNLTGAAQTLNDARHRAPRDPRLFMLAGLMAEKSGNLQGAFDAMRRSETLAPDWAPGLLEQALLFARHNREHEAMSAAEKVIALEPNNARVIAGVIDIAHRVGNTDMAIRHLRRVLELTPEDRVLRRYLAVDLGAVRQYDEALAVFGPLIDEQPDDHLARIGRVQMLQARGTMQEALPDTTALLALQPEDKIYQYYHQLAQGEVPAHVPVELTTHMFDDMASVYDMHMVRHLAYQLPKQVADQLLQIYPNRSFNLLDLGCGTGLLGASLGAIDGYIMGVDMSSKMLEQAAKHKVYYKFHQVNLLEALAATPANTFEAITALDVLIYVGDLQQTLADAYRVLAPGGVLIFSCEHGDVTGPDTQLHAFGRYTHTLSSTVRLAKAAGFDRVDTRDVELRMEAGQAVDGFVVTAYKPQEA
ncbi:methyltransferase domain-containing protein [Comamonas piscis]|uniref:Methyltransferase domain-containing protein n=1 Tax=Comamonas piscis TaxID=1562974 RepID=A0A7G5ELV9_9BURK|nr:methyltransferase domain-containing protein [Comamonas piscis]QMV74984.1 methyltransferase domain-containing protein [Comamonas piscis]WSO33464.1 methyltransferase domain-containing protein [Comamonas piscis]